VPDSRLRSLILRAQRRPGYGRRLQQRASGPLTTCTTMKSPEDGGDLGDQRKWIAISSPYALTCRYPLSRWAAGFIPIQQL